MQSPRLIQNVFVLLLLALFACLSVFLVMVGAQAYRGTVDRADINNDHRIAAALVRRGFAADKADAFRRFLARGAPAYAERFRLSPETAIEVARGAGGMVALAHPATTGYNVAELERFVSRLADAGLEGLECLYSGHLPRQVEEYVGLAHKFGLVITGGTDYHGTNKPNIRIGVAYGGLHVRDEAFDEIAARLARRNQTFPDEPPAEAGASGEVGADSLTRPR